MPSSNDSAISATGYVERVRSRDTPLESRFVFLAVFGILIVGTVSLLTVRRDAMQTFDLPVPLTNLATQLSNARDEIQLLQDIDLLNATPDLTALIEAELAPFEQEGVLQPIPGCLVFDRHPFLVRFRQAPLETDGWSIAWLDDREDESTCDDHGQRQMYKANLK